MRPWLLVPSTKMEILLLAFGREMENTVLLFSHQEERKISVDIELWATTIYYRLTLSHREAEKCPAVPDQV